MVLPEQKPGREPRGEDVDREKNIELVQRSESPNTSDKPNITPATKPDNHGDVEVNELNARFVVFRFGEDLREGGAAS